MGRAVANITELYQGAEMGLTELQNKNWAAKKTAGRYKLWADGKERHIQQEWQWIVVGLQKVLQLVQVKVQAALTESTVHTQRNLHCLWSLDFICQYCYLWVTTSDSFYHVPPVCTTDGVPISVIWKAKGLSCDTYLHHSMLQSPLFPRLPFQDTSQPKCCIHSLYYKQPEQPLAFPYLSLSW